MDHYAMSHGTMVGTMVGSQMENTSPSVAASRRWIVLLAVMPSIALGSLLLSVLPGYADPALTRDIGLDARQAPKLAATAASQTVVLAAKGGRLLKNGTRARSDNDSEKKSENAAPNSAAADAPPSAGAATEPAGKAASSATPAIQAVATKPAAHTMANGPVDLSEQLTPIAGLGRNPTDIECIANCPRSTPTTRIGGPRQAVDTSLTDGGMECIAGCYGVAMTSTIVDSRDLPALAQQGAARHADGTGQSGQSGQSGHRVTVLRGVTKSKVYTPTN